MFVLLSLVVLQFACLSSSQSPNKFEATFGCLQYNADHGFNYLHPYFPTGRLRHVKANGTVTRMRMGVVGQSDGIIRLSPVRYPYDNTDMNEIVLSGWANTKIQVRRYTRTSPTNYSGYHVLKSQSSIGMLSYFQPFMFTMAVHQGGLVQLTRDDDAVPLLEFEDPELSANYMGFCNWDVPVVFFYDCPL